MTKLIANEQVWIGFRAKAMSETNRDTISAASDIAAGGVDLTGFLVTLDSSTRGNVVPTPSLDTTFETSISGTVNATFMAEFYRDDTTDTAWDALARGTVGYFYIERMAGGVAPVQSDVLECWPVIVTARSANPLTSNDSQRFTIECSVPIEPNEAVTVGA